MKVVKSECVQTMKPKDLASKFWDEAEEEALSVTPKQLSRRGHSPRRGTLLKIPGERRFGDKQEFNFEDVKFQTLRHLGNRPGAFRVSVGVWASDRAGGCAERRGTEMAVIFSKIWSYETSSYFLPKIS